MGDDPVFYLKPSFAEVVLSLLSCFLQQDRWPYRGKKVPKGASWYRSLYAQVLRPCPLAIQEWGGGCFPGVEGPPPSFVGLRPLLPPQSGAGRLVPKTTETKKTNNNLAVRTSSSAGRERWRASSSVWVLSPPPRFPTGPLAGWRS